MAYCECKNPDHDGPKCKNCGDFVRGYSFYDEEMSVGPLGRGNAPGNVADMHDPDDPTR